MEQVEFKKFENNNTNTNHSLAIYSNDEANLNELATDGEYQKIKNYLILLRAEIPDQKDLGENFFKKNKNDQSIYSALNKIIEDLNESEDIRLQATVMLKKLYNINNYNPYSKSNKKEEDMHIDNTIKSIASRQHYEPIQKKHKWDLNKNIDCLPYVDQQLKDETRIKEEMNRLIKEEMMIIAQTHKADDYLHSYFQQNNEHLFLHNIKNHELIEKELERVERGKKLNVFTSDINTHFENPPPNKLHNNETWEKLIKNIQLSLSQFNIMNINLDLLIKYGPEAWKKYLNKYETMIMQLEQEKLSLENKIEEINKERKFKQVESSEKLNELTNKLNYQIHQNVGIHKECTKLSYKIKKLLKYKSKKLKRKIRQTKTA